MRLGTESGALGWLAYGLSEAPADYLGHYLSRRKSKGRAMGWASVYVAGLLGRVGSSGSPAAFVHLPNSPRRPHKREVVLWRRTDRQHPGGGKRSRASGTRCSPKWRHPRNQGIQQRRVRWGCERRGFLAPVSGLGPG